MDPLLPSGSPNSADPNPEQKASERTGLEPRSVPPSLRRLYALTLAGTSSPRQAIKMMCTECCGYDRQAVAECPAWPCPLWQYRPWRSRAEDPGTTRQTRLANQPQRRRPAGQKGQRT